MSSAAAWAVENSSMERPDKRQWIPVTFLDSPWVFESLRALDKMEELGDNWDGYGSPRIAPSALTSARSLVASVGVKDVSSPHVSPVTGGAVGLHWRAGTRELELTVLPDGQVEYLMVLKQDLERDDSMETGVLAAERAATKVVTMLKSLLAG